MATNDIWDHKAWVWCERILGLLSLLVLTVMIWNTLIRIEAKQSKVDATLEQIRKQMGNDELWQKAVNSIRNNSRK